MCSRLQCDKSGALDCWTTLRLLALTFDDLRYPVISIEDIITTSNRLEQQTIGHFKSTPTQANRDQARRSETTRDNQEAKCVLKNLFIVISSASSPSLPWAFAAAALSSAAVSTSFGTP